MRILGKDYKISAMDCDDQASHVTLTLEEWCYYYTCMDKRRFSAMDEARNLSKNTSRDANRDTNLQNACENLNEDMGRKNNTPIIRDKDRDRDREKPLNVLNDDDSNIENSSKASDLDDDNDNDNEEHDVSAMVVRVMLLTAILPTCNIIVDIAIDMNI